jgi:cystathionine beta-lyase/cystathionine gamma-synthase
MSSSDRTGGENTATTVIHGGEGREDHPYGAVVAPVFHSSSYGFKTFAEMRDYANGKTPGSFFYSRYANPTVAECERKIAELEGAEDAVVVSSGSAATMAALLALCETGDEVIACDSIYGGTTKILRQLLGKFGIKARFVSIGDIARLPELATPKTRLFWFESPANPINRLVDLDLAASRCKEAGLFSVIDSTFATPVLQRPIAHGIDAVMHSATKYLGGHSDLTAGVVAGQRSYIEQVRRIAVMVGLTLDPAAAFLLLRGLKTLELRVRASCENAMRLAEMLHAHPRVQRVYYPGLAGSPDFELASRQMRAFGSVVALDIKGGEPQAERFFDSLRLVRSAPSLGGVESLASYPLYSSHYGYTEEQLSAAGVSEATIRIAVGIEAADDIVADVCQALDRI